MRLLGVAVVRNEADVIEAFVRHNLSALDALLVAEQGSIDGTAHILARLQADALPLRVVCEANGSAPQATTSTALAREALAHGADFVFALEPDEFLKCRSRATLERALSEVPAGTHAVMHWLSYVPDAFDSSAGSFGQGHLWRRLKEERHGLFKVIVGRGLLDRPDDALGAGNHYVQGSQESSVRPHARLRPDVVALARCPVRSRPQFESQVILDHLARLAGEANPRRPMRLWDELYAELRAGSILTDERLREIACNYGLALPAWQPVSAIELIEDPVPLAVEQRYRDDVVPGPLPLLLRRAEQLIAAERKGSATSTATQYYRL